MQAEQLEICGFLGQHPPFSTLPEEALQQIAREIEVSYFRAGSPILSFGDEIHDLYMIRSGSVEIFRRDGKLYDRISEGDLFGQMGLLMNNRVRLPTSALEDTLVYCIPEAVFSNLCDRFVEFADFVEVEDRTRLRQTVSRQQDASDLMTSRVTALISREPVTVSTTETIQNAAVIMTRECVSSLLITDADAEGEDRDSDPRLAGIITNRDLRSRVLAKGLSLQTPVSEIMSTDLISLDHHAYAFEAMLAMLRYNLHHLPVLKHKRLIGVICLSDIVRYESQNSLYVVSGIFRCQNTEELAALSEAVRACFVRMVNEDANSHMIGSAMAVIGCSFKQRLLELAEEALGPPPVPYCFLALGSMARDEQLIVTDQDNALILGDNYDPERHNAYFEQLSTFVCDGLAACGYSYCKGEIMATNPQWRKTRREWEDCFADWIDNPNPQGLLNSSIFFDLAGVWGRIDWADQLNEFVVRRARRNPRFLACLARNALNRTPPLGFFRDFVMEQDGRHNNSINLKRRGTAPLADLIRVHALAVGSSSRNSFERLNDVLDADLLPRGKGSDLRDALEFISLVRIRHQALDLEAGRDADNNIEPENLSDFERRNLKDAFSILRNAQKFLKFRYQSRRSG